MSSGWLPLRTGPLDKAQKHPGIQGESLRQSSATQEDEDDVMREISGFRAASASAGGESAGGVSRPLFRSTGEGERPPAARVLPGKTHSFNTFSSPPSSKRPPSMGSPGGSLPRTLVGGSGDSLSGFDSIVKFWKEAENKASIEDFNKLKVELDRARDQAQVRCLSFLSGLQSYTRAIW